MKTFLRAAAVVVAVTLSGTALPSMAETAPARLSPTTATTASTASTAPAPTARTTAAARPLAGIVIALDPGHQLGNHRYPAQINRLVPAGGFTKPCNTTGTATTSGVAESTVNWQISRAVQSRLQALGATVRLTRSSDSQQLWGPCVNRRGQFGRSIGARLEVSLHADGARSSAYGFHVIAPTRRAPWTSDIATASLRLARSLRNGLTAGGLPRSTYIGGGTGLDVRSDLGTLNMSDVPIAMIEVGNMKNARDARRMTTTTGRAAYADGVVRGIRSYLGR